MHSTLRALLPACALALAGCAAAPPRNLVDLPAGTTAPGLPASFELIGRISVREAERGFSGGVRWQHGPEGDELLFSTPLGQGVAEIVSRPGEARLTTAGARHVAADAESLTEKLMGWRLPVAGLTWWVLGSNAPGSPATAELDAGGRVARLYQDGWEISYLDYVTASGRALPRTLEASREALEIRLSVTDWFPGEASR
jgi:outer membrane lipoprotein LolB